ncbi:hypothetical protein C2E23DRAFT_34464 [Lenzites betulinus]|nr:hypothetical protein C2E23DRAFT_34464 [Lenzites betulinus]
MPLSLSLPAFMHQVASPARRISPVYRGVVPAPVRVHDQAVLQSFILDAWHEEWNAGSWGGYDIARKECAHGADHERGLGLPHDRDGAHERRGRHDQGQ